jgi:hypothetical protein
MRHLPLPASNSPIWARPAAITGQVARDFPIGEPQAALLSFAVAIEHRSEDGRAKNRRVDLVERAE